MANFTTHLHLRQIRQTEVKSPKSLLAYTRRVKYLYIRTSLSIIPDYRKELKDKEIGIMCILL